MAYTGSLTQSDAWKDLAEHHEKVRNIHMRDWFAEDPNRFHNFHLEAAGLSLDYSKNRVTKDTMSMLLRLAQEQDLSQ